MQAHVLLAPFKDRAGVMAVRIGVNLFGSYLILHIFACAFHVAALWNTTSVSWMDLNAQVNKNSLAQRYGNHQL